MGILETKGLCHHFGGMDRAHPGESEHPRRRTPRHHRAQRGGQDHAVQRDHRQPTPPKAARCCSRGLDVTKTKPFKLNRMGLGRSFSDHQHLPEADRLREHPPVRCCPSKKIRYDLLRRTDTLKRVSDETDEILKQINLYDERHELTSKPVLRQAAQPGAGHGHRHQPGTCSCSTSPPRACPKEEDPRGRGS